MEALILETPTALIMHTTPCENIKIKVIQYALEKFLNLIFLKKRPRVIFS